MKNLQAYAAVIMAALALAAAVGTGYVAVAAKPSSADVEHIVDRNTADKFAEIQRRLAAIDNAINHVLDKLDQKE